MNTYTRNRFARSTVFENNCSKNHRVMEESRFTRGRGGRLAFENLFSGGENVIPRYKRSDKLKVSADTQYLKNTSKVQYYHPKGINMSYDNPSPVWGDYPQRRRRNQQPTFQQQRQQGFDAWLRQLDGTYICIKITPSLTTRELANWFRVSPQKVGFHHQGATLTNQIFQQVKKGGGIGMYLK
ncbi:uncharacterized protein LOC135684316 isoform X6 [Rhopilema esculentum]|uniref:uncharacterized protein LOC135684316 isoform X6 n=1 Tax=Rhopilema esculentum TaxID=499914 RepID=UPI0031CE5E9A